MSKKVSVRRSKRSKRTSVIRKINPDVAGIDAGSREHWVSVPPDRALEPTRSFATHTAALHEMAMWLTGCGINSVAIESTGVFWIPLFEVLEGHGLEVSLIDARSVRRPNKSDVLDCEWIREVHSCGLYSVAFRPAKDVASLRALVRHRRMLIEYGADHIQHMQKALDLMNLRLNTVVDDVTGATGMRIIRAILDGERDPQKLAMLRDKACKHSELEIAQALFGHWRAEHLFALKHAVQLWSEYQKKIGECDIEIEAVLLSFAQKVSRTDLPKPKGRGGRPRKNEPRFDARSLLYETLGVDLTAIEGVSASTVLTVLSEIGYDMSRFPSHRALASYLRVCPGTRITGGKKLSSRTHPTTNRATTALRLAAQSLERSKGSLGAFYRRKRVQLNSVEQAITATAHKILRIIYAMITSGKPYFDPGPDHQEKIQKQRAIRAMQKKAHRLGFTLVPLIPTSAPEPA